MITATPGRTAGAGPAGAVHAAGPGAIPAAHPTEQCHLIEDVLAVLGRAWAGAVLQAMLDGAERFSDIGRATPGVTDAVLSARLKELGARGLVTRVVHPGPPVVVTYLLTPAGRDVEPVLKAVRDFGKAHPHIARPRPERRTRRDPARPAE